LIHGLDRSHGGFLLGYGCCSLALGGARSEDIIFFNLALIARDRDVPLLWSVGLRTYEQQRL
jgi:hypothetical protein